MEFQEGFETAELAMNHSVSSDRGPVTQSWIGLSTQATPFLHTMSPMRTCTCIHKTLGFFKALVQSFRWSLFLSSSNNLVII